jgi:hypothetical protein
MSVRLRGSTPDSLGFCERSGKSTSATKTSRSRTVPSSPVILTSPSIRPVSSTSRPVRSETALGDDP